MANNLWIWKTEAEGSYCNTESGNHVDVVSGTTASIQIAQATARGDDWVDVDGEERTPDSKHATMLTTPSSSGLDTQRPAQHTVGGI